MYLFVRLTLIIILACTSFIGSSQDLKQGMMYFDKAFIPLWCFTLDKNAADAKKSIPAVKLEWQQLYMIALHDGENEDVNQTFCRIADWLDESYVAIETNCFEVAQNQLDHVRYEFMELRRRQELDYYLDYYLDFEDILLDVLEIGGDPLLCLQDWNEFEHLSQKMTQAWETALQQNFDADFFGFTPLQVKSYQLKQEFVSRQVRAFNEAIASADQCKVDAEGAQLKTAFVRMILLFGNFHWEVNPHIEQSVQQNQGDIF